MSTSTSPLSCCFPRNCSRELKFPKVASYLTTSHVSLTALKGDGAHESNESRERCQEGNDSNRGVQKRRRIDGRKGERREGSDGSPDGRGSNWAKESWLLQDCRHAQLEAQAETSDTRTEGRESIHERALCLQGQASVESSTGSSDEKAQGTRELNDDL